MGVAVETAKVEPLILQQKLRDSRLVDNFFAQLTIYGNPICAGFLNNFAILIKLLDFKSNLILISENKFALKPLFNLFIAFALEPDIIFWIAFCKLNNKRPGDSRVVIALNPNFFSVEALQFLEVERHIVF